MSAIFLSVISGRNCNRTADKKDKAAAKNIVMLYLCKTSYSPSEIPNNAPSLATKEQTPVRLVLTEKSSCYTVMLTRKVDLQYFFH